MLVLLLVVLLVVMMEGRNSEGQAGRRGGESTRRRRAEVLWRERMVVRRRWEATVLPVMVRIDVEVWVGMMLESVWVNRLAHGVEVWRRRG